MLLEAIKLSEKKKEIIIVKDSTSVIDVKQANMPVRLERQKPKG
jgi:hypothetical protein